LDQPAGAKELVFIDFEYSSYNYRAFDFANHFCEWMIDYTLEQAPYFTITPENFPTEQEQSNFIGAYLAASGQADVSGETVKKVIEETAAFLPVSHFVWGVWALLQLELSPVKFGFAEYGRTRLSHYFQLRPNLLKLLKSDGDRGTNGNVRMVIGGGDSIGSEINGQASEPQNGNGREES
jgi:choline/ethanolamine kinase